MPLITIGDFIDIIYRSRTRGIPYLSAKFSLNKTKRVKSSWDHSDMKRVNWWNIPAVINHLNKKISGDEQVGFIDYVVRRYFRNSENLIALSPACGNGHAEMKLARYNQFKLVEAFDLAPEAINLANREKDSENIRNINFFVKNFYDFRFEENRYDLILFNSSLHHFTGIEEVLHKVKYALKQDGLLVIREYTGPNRFQYSLKQLNTINKLLAGIPHEYRRKFITGSMKRKVYRPGRLRMVISDPSEAPESETILPLIHEHFSTVEEKTLGGNILAYLLKDIGHHFQGDDKKAREILDILFKEEDKYLEKNQSEMIFGVYKKNG